MPYQKFFGGEYEYTHHLSGRKITSDIFPMHHLAFQHRRLHPRGERRRRHRPGAQPALRHRRVPLEDRGRRGLPVPDHGVLRHRHQRGRRGPRRRPGRGELSAMSRIGIGIAQLACAPLDVAANVATTTAALRAAAGRGARLVVLPELAATGYVLDRAAAAGPGGEHAGPRARALRLVARRPASTASSSSAASPSATGTGCTTRWPSSTPDGEIAGTYRKLHLFGRERDVFAPGRPRPARVRGRRPAPGRGGLLRPPLPRGGAHPGAARRRPRRRARPRGWPASTQVTSPTESIGQVDGALVQGNLNSVFLACADQVGAAGAVHLPRPLARRRPLRPRGGRAPGPRSPRTVVVVEIDPADARAARHRGPGISPLDDRRTDVYGDLLGYREPSPDPSPHPSEAPDDRHAACTPRAAARTPAGAGPPGRGVPDHPHPVRRPRPSPTSTPGWATTATCGA